MPIQGLLVAAFIVILVVFMRNTGSHAASAWKRMLFVAFMLAAIAAVIFPDELTVLANVLGIGRGADLLLYATVAGLVFSMTMIYFKFRDLDRKITELARHIAVMESMDERTYDRSEAYEEA